MAEIPTGQLTDVLMQMEPCDFSEYRQKYLSVLSAIPFSEYYLAVLSEKGMRRSTAVAQSGLEVHYAYQILNGTKNPKRDKILCLCIGGAFSLQETNRALERAAFGRLYPKRLRDAVMMLALNHGVHTVWEVNALLAEEGVALLA